VIKHMTKMKAYPDFRMVCNRILPRFEDNLTNNIMSQLRSADLPYGVVVDAMLLQFLSKQDLKAAAKFTQSHNK